MPIGPLCIGVWFVLMHPGTTSAANESAPRAPDSPRLIVLGTAQDAGYPQAGCQRECCHEAWQDADVRRTVSCIAIVDPENQQRWLLDCTPDFPAQLKLLDELSWPVDGRRPLDGILLTHAHIGHYTGLIHLGREVIGSAATPVFAMPRMTEFLRENGPWSQLIELQQIELRRLSAGDRIALNERISCVPFLVPHRDEYSETVGFIVSGPTRSALFLPDIDKWNRWDVAIEDLIAEVDVAFLDGTFFADGEVPGRSIDEIPHPFIEESIRRFESLPEAERDKIHFIHLNHINPVLRANSAARRAVEQSGHHVAQPGWTLEL